MSTKILGADERVVRLALAGVSLEGSLSIPADATGIVVFAHGSGSSRHSPRNRFVARELQEGGLATLLLDLLTPEEERVDLYTRHLRFDIPRLAIRLAAATDWLATARSTRHLRAGYFGASTGAAAALMAAAQRRARIGAVVSRGGRPDLAGRWLSRVTAPTLLIVGGDDTTVLGLNQSALSELGGERRLEIVPGASHLFEEPGALEVVARLAREWFSRYLALRPAAVREQG